MWGEIEQLQVCLLSAILKTSSKKEREREREREEGRKKRKEKRGKSNSFGLPYTGERNGKPLQYSYLENPMDRGAR